MTMSMAAAAAIVQEELDSEDEDRASHQRFIRPVVGGFIDFLRMQHELPHMGDTMYKDNLRMPRHTFDLLVRECRPWIPKRMPVRDVIGVAVHWLATGASTRVQEALFMNQNFTQIAKYRKAGVLAILKAMKKNGIYGNEPHEHDRMTNTTAAFGLEHPMFGRCLGALDGTHVPIIVPQTMETRFRNRKADITTNRELSEAQISTLDRHFPL
ncbi:hypothetical protein LEN26_016696 [Aphanomyces euteiches]|nr:hypothetical protein LEN26_016696 [Aphanomyces euteiches]